MVNSNNLDGEQAPQNKEEKWSLQEQLNKVKKKRKKKKKEELPGSKKCSSKDHNTSSRKDL